MTEGAAEEDSEGGEKTRALDLNFVKIICCERR